MTDEISDKEKKELASSSAPGDAKVALLRNFEFKVPLSWLLAAPPSGKTPDKSAALAAKKLRLRFSLWHDRLPVDALPLEGWMELQLVSESDLLAQS